MIMKPVNLGAKCVWCRRDHRVVERVRSRLCDTVIGQDNQPWSLPGNRSLQQPNYPQPPKYPGQKLTFVGNATKYHGRTSLVLSCRLPTRHCATCLSVLSD